MAIPHFRTLYVAPTMNQSSLFSSTKLQPVINGSPIFRKHFVTPSLPMAAWQKHLTNGSIIALSYASDDPDRVRGYSADAVVYDEIQDILFDAVVPVITECTGASDYGWVMYFGTPKSVENTIEVLWQQSTQNEWVMRCSGCNNWNYVDSTDSIGKRGIICVRCGNYLNPRAGRWHQLKPGAPIEGFHIPQLIMTSNNEVDARWERILYKYRTYSEHRFKNEVLGVSDSVGTRMVSLDDLYALCRDFVFQMPPSPDLMQDVLWTVAGVDWSGGGAAGLNSRTVLHIWGRLPDGRLKTVFYKVFPVANAMQDVRDIVDICRTFNCVLVAGDAGGGAVANAALAEELGKHRVVQLQYGASSKMIAWNGKDRYLVDRTAAIDSMMLNYKRAAVLFSHRHQMQDAFDDIMSVYEEVTRGVTGRKIWNRSPQTPDDSLHAQVFGWLAAEIASHKVQFYQASTTLD